MIVEPRCSKRNCRHLAGVEQPTGEERSEHVTCAAFHEGIPFEIAYGDDLHLTPRPDQGNDIAYEPFTQAELDGRPA